MFKGGKSRTPKPSRKEGIVKKTKVRQVQSDFSSTDTSSSSGEEGDTATDTVGKVQEIVTSAVITGQGRMWLLRSR